MSEMVTYSCTCVDGPNGRFISGIVVELCMDGTKFATMTVRKNGFAFSKTSNTDSSVIDNSAKMYAHTICAIIRYLVWDVESRFDIDEYCNES